MNNKVSGILESLKEWLMNVWMTFTRANRILFVCNISASGSSWMQTLTRKSRISTHWLISIYWSILLLSFVYYSWWLLILILDWCTLGHDHLVLCLHLLLILNLDVDWIIALHCLHLFMLLLLFLHHLLLLMFFHYLTVWTQLLHTVAAGCIASQTSLIEDRTLGAWWHFSNLAFELQMWHPITIEILLFEHCLLIEKTFGEGVILLFNSFSFSFSHAHVQTGRPF